MVENVWKSGIYRPTERPFPVSLSYEIPYAIRWAEKRCVAGRNGSNMAPLMIAQAFGCKVYRYLSRRSIEAPIERRGPWGIPDVPLVAARNARECADFEKLIGSWSPGVRILVTPSEVTPPRGDVNLRTQNFRIDAAMLGDALCGV